MPLYTFRCLSCRVKQDRFLRIDDRDAQRVCECGAGMTRIVTAAHVAPDYPGYECPVTGKWIEGRVAHQENLRRTGSRLLEPGETEASRRGLREADATLEKEVGQTVDRLIAEMPSDKRDALGSAMSNGLGTAVSRPSPP